MLQLLGALLLLLASCSISGPLRVDKTASNYFFPEPPPGWQKKPPAEGAEIIYVHRGTDAYLSVSSLCERYEDSKLETLARSALSPIENLQDKETKTFMMDGREAFELYASGKLDGVPVQVDYVSWRKDDCLFDFSLQAADKITPQVREEFFSMLKKFRYKR